MANLRILAASAAILSIGVGAAALAQQDYSAQLAARQGQFRIMALNIGIVGNMARGNTEYDAAMAQLAADNLVAISTVNQTPHWPEGSDNMAIDNTRALPAIWDNQDDFLSKWQAFGAAAQGLQAVAGDGLEALQAAVGPVGGACGACHDDYRQPQ